MVFGDFDDLGGERADVVGALGHQRGLLALHSLETAINNKPDGKNK